MVHSFRCCSRQIWEPNIPFPQLFCYKLMYLSHFFSWQWIYLSLPWHKIFFYLYHMIPHFLSFQRHRFIYGTFEVPISWPLLQTLLLSLSFFPSSAFSLLIFSYFFFLFSSFFYFYYLDFLYFSSYCLPHFFRHLVIFISSIL